MDIDEVPTARVVMSWTEGTTARTATVLLAAEGVELDLVVDLLVDGLEASTTPDFIVEVAEVTERVTRPKRARPALAVRELPIARPAPSIPVRLDSAPTDRGRGATPPAPGKRGPKL